ncbi:M56 family metallopeptidase [Parasediminibacterium paludis]|uniref:M56 family metallopeptidase n=1 Tax=Parasediminibacterium paludis TaxID=908966 RepID=A0ABV8PU26_9BACT
MIAYLVKMVLCSAVLLLVYHVLLAKEKMHRFNRYYLLLSLIFALVVPFIEWKQQIPIISDSTVTENVFYATETTFKTMSSAIEEPVSDIDIWPNLLIAAYFLISTILLIRFARNLFQLWLKIKNSEKILCQNSRLVLLPQSIVSHSFLKYIFIAKEDYNNGAFEQAILNHELAHVQQKHSLDILFIEVLSIIFWFNPFLYWYKKAIQINHEFLADAAALETYHDVASYQYLLLAQANKPVFNHLASQFNFLITKKRLLMMNKTTSFTRKAVKQLAIVPIIGSLVFVFSSKIIAQDTLKKFTEKIRVSDTANEQVVPTKDLLFHEKKTQAKILAEDFYKKTSIGYSATDASDELMKEYETIAKKYRRDTTNRWQSIFRDITQQDKTRLIAIFTKMSLQQQLKQSVVFCKQLGPLKREVPTETQFNNFKKANVYGIWIDDKRVKNEVLNNFKASDFAQFDISKLYGAAKVGRSYTHQVNMMTKAYYQKYYDESIAKKDEPMMVMRFIKNVTVVNP